MHFHLIFGQGLRLNDIPGNVGFSVQVTFRGQPVRITSKPWLIAVSASEIIYYILGCLVKAGFKINYIKGHTIYLAALPVIINQKKGEETWKRKLVL